MKALAKKQRGLGFFGFIMVAIGVILVAILGMKVVPPYIHSAQIAQIFKSIANDPGMQGASVHDIKESYLKRANINYIEDVGADDIVIDKVDGRLILSTSYSVKIRIAGNVTLVLDFNPSSS